MTGPSLCRSISHRFDPGSHDPPAFPEDRIEVWRPDSHELPEGALSDVRQAIPIEAARQPLLPVTLPGGPAGSGWQRSLPFHAALSRASNPLARRCTSA
jgi:hypothetical protein